LLELPFEIFGLFLAVVFGLVALGVSRQIPIFVFAGGLFFMFMSALVTTVTMGYEYDIEVSYNNSTEIITEDSTAVPIVFEFTNWVKVLFTLIGALIMFLGWIVYRGVT